MRGLLRRIERLENTGGRAMQLCRSCTDEGLTETPYERCQDGNCEQRHQTLELAMAERRRYLLGDDYKPEPMTPEDEAFIASIRAGVRELVERERREWREKRGY